MLIEAVDHPILCRFPGGEIRMEPGKPVDLPEARALRLLDKAAGKVRCVTPEPPLLPGWLVAYRDRSDNLRGGCVERDHGTVQACRWNGTVWTISLTNGDTLPLGLIVSVGKTDEEGNVVAAWTVKAHGHDEDGRRA